MNGTCPQTLTGLFAGVTLHCDLVTDHHGKHRSDELGPVVDWSDNSYSLTRAAA